MSFYLLRRCAGAAFVTALLLLCCMRLAFATSTSAFLSGTVTQNGKPVAGAQITAAGNNRTYKTTTNTQGRFQFPPFGVGTYNVEARFGDAHGSARIDLSTSGASVTIPIGLKEIGAVVVTSSNTLRGSGSDVALNHSTLTQMPFNNSFSEMEIQLPGRRARRQRRRPHQRRPRRHQLHDRRRRAAAGAQSRHRRRDQPQRSFVRRPDRRRISRPVRAALRLGLQYGDARRHGTGRLRRLRLRSVRTATCNSTIGYHAPIAGGGGFDIALSGRANDARARSAEFQLAAQRRQLGQPVCALYAAGRREQLHERHLHQQPWHVSDPERRATTASRPRPTTTRRKTTRFWPCSSTTRSATPASLTFGPAFKVSHDPRLRRSRRTTSSTAKRSTSTPPPVRQRRHVDRLRRTR